MNSNKKILEVKISNNGPKSYKMAAILALPATWSECNDALQKARIEDGSHCKITFLQTEFHGIPSNRLENPHNLYETNLLAQRLSLLNDVELLVFDGLLKIEQKQSHDPLSLSKLIHLTFYTDACSIAPQISNCQELGVFLYEGELLPDEAMRLLDSTEPDSTYYNGLLEAFGKDRQESEKGTFVDGNYIEPSEKYFSEFYKPGEIFDLFRSEASPIILEVMKGFFNAPDYDNDQTAILTLPATDDDIWTAVEAVDAASSKECGFYCIDCLIPSLRDVINDAIDDEDGVDQANEFAQLLSDKVKIWTMNDTVRYKALLEAVGFPNLQSAAQLMEELDQYEFFPEIAQNWDYEKLVLQEKCPEFPADLFQPGRFPTFGQEILDQKYAVLTDYGLIRRVDGAPLSRADMDQQKNGMEEMPFEP